jgi:hypothetical protein
VAGCAGYGPPAPTSVARGEYFATGNPDYDEFFVRLFRLQIELGRAPDSLAQTRATLSRRLGLAEKADPESVRSALNERASELRAHGLVVRVEKGGADGAVALAVTGDKNPTDAELLTALEQALGAVSALRISLPAWRKELELLPARGVALESGIEAAFVGTGRGTRNEVRENLADAQKIMGLMGTRLKELDATSAELTDAFVAAFPEATPAPPPAPEPAQAEPAPKPKSKQRSRGAGRGASTKPAPKPAEARDEPKPAKPTPGPAKPDFEP